MSMENASNDIPGLDTSSDYEDAQSHTSTTHGEHEELLKRELPFSKDNFNSHFDSEKSKIADIITSTTDGKRQRTGKSQRRRRGRDRLLRNRL